MQPNSLQPQPVNFNPNTQQAKQKKLIRLIIIIAAVAVLVLVLAAVFTPKDTTNETLSLSLARHQEMTRILDEYSDNARSAEARHLVANTKLVILSGTSDMVSAGVSVSTGQADAVKIAGIDDTLQEAARNNRFDETITEFITANLEANASELKTIQSDLEGESAQVVERLLSDYNSLL